jgi:DNA modification methylase
LRNYGKETEAAWNRGGWVGQLGFEDDFNQYVRNLCDVFDEVKRVLKDAGTCWVVIGDTYWNGSKAYPGKSLCLVPQRFQVEMVDRGWRLRNLIVWEKPDGTPSTATDRFTVNFECILFFSKSEDYYFEQQFEDSAERRDTLRNMRCVWRIPTSRFTGAHCAVFPEKLVARIIEAGCPRLVCDKCGQPKERVVEKKVLDMGKRYGDKTAREIGASRTSGLYHKNKKIQYRFPGYRQCDCGTSFSPGIVLDPFLGSGTTAVVAKRLGRNYVGTELNRDYVRMAEERVRSPSQSVRNRPRYSRD